MKDIAFTIIEEDEMYINKKREYKIYFDGHIEGFRNKCYTINYALPEILKLKALEQQFKEDQEYIAQLEKRLHEAEMTW